MICGDNLFILIVFVADDAVRTMAGMLARYIFVLSSRWASDVEEYVVCFAVFVYVCLSMLDL